MKTNVNIPLLAVINATANVNYTEELIIIDHLHSLNYWQMFRVRKAGNVEPGIYIYKNGALWAYNTENPEGKRIGKHII